LHAAHAHLAMGNLLIGERERARRVEGMRQYVAALRLYEGAGATGRCLLVLLNLSMVCLAVGQPQDARQHAGRALTMADAAGSDELAQKAMARISLAAYLEGNDADAEQRLKESLLRAPETSVDRVGGLYIRLVTMAAIAARHEWHEAAARLAGAAAGVAARRSVDPHY